MVDASALVEYLLRTESFQAVAGVIETPGIDLHTPALCDMEVAAAVRRALLADLTTEDRARSAFEDYLDLPLTRHGHQALLGRILDLRDNFSAYDAVYVALVERLDARLLSADQPLVRAIREQTGLTTLDFKP